ncbi:unannotated protein [freshwater metagenome]|uniref:Unannotated protein n=1 Tax=freshwater metagenome TaxID=449393 RepID=A0A6J7FHR4_9ZZZZ|nr:hypothetical protein [Actinomycetota bacterium]
MSGPPGPGHRWDTIDPERPDPHTPDDNTRAIAEALERLHRALQKTLDALDKHLPPTGDGDR